MTEPMPTGLGAEEVDFEQMAAEAAVNANKPPVLEGAAIPEQFRGKSVNDLLEEIRKREEALRISEEARQRTLEEAVRRPAPPAVPPPPAPEEPKLPTKEELAAMYAEDPIAALEIYGQFVEQRITKNLSGRMAPLADAGVVAAEQVARAKYAEEFELFGSEIDKAKGMIPDKSFLANPQNWDQLIAYVRGTPGNFERLIEARNKKNADLAAAAARNAQAATSGFQSTARVTPPVRTEGDPSYHGLDETERKVAETLGQSYADFAKWKRRG